MNPRGRRVAWAGAATGAAAAGGLGATAAWVDLGTADQLASVVGAIIGVVSLAVAVYALAGDRATGPSRRDTDAPDARPDRRVEATGQGAVAAGGGIGLATTGDGTHVRVPAPHRAEPSAPAGATPHTGDTSVRADGAGSVAAGGNIGVAMTGHHSRYVEQQTVYEFGALPGAGLPTYVMGAVAAPGLHLVATLTDRSASAYSVSFSADATLLATARKTNGVVLWNVAVPERPASVTSFGQVVSEVVFRPRGHVLGTASRRGVELWDVSRPAEPQHLSSLPAADRGRTLAWGPGDLLAVPEDGGVALWRVREPSRPERVGACDGHTDGVRVLRFAPAGHLLAAGTERDVVLWNIQDAHRPIRLSTLTGHSGPVTAVAFAPGGRLLATASHPDPGTGERGNLVILWDIGDPRNPVRTATLTGHRTSVMAVSFTADGTSLITGSWDNTLVLWDVGDPADPARISGIDHTGAVLAAEFAAEADLLAVGSNENAVMLWRPVDRAGGNGPGGA